MAKKKPLAKCKICGNKFEILNSLRPYCSYDCGAKYAIRLQENKKEKELKDKIKGFKESLKTKSDYIKILQIVFNKFIRERDKELPCISCGRFDVEEFHAGHFVATTYQYHRFNEDNVHKQCSYCNTHLRGNISDYRRNLIKKIGLERVEYLENTKHMMFDLSIEDLKQLITKYKKTNG